ncbi:MAG: catalase [Myxococcales bacterium]|nr:MAG: catalase [Myxococcales bacterium]
MAFGETIAQDEEEQFKAFGEEIGALQRERAAARGGQPLRALHLKQHHGAVGELVVKAPDTARHGVFSMSGKSWPVYVRFSNGSSRHQGDGEPDVRGFALKLVGVPGQKLIPELTSATTQDFLLIDTPIIPFRNPAEFMMFVRSAKDGPAKLLPRLIGHFGLGRALGILWGALRADKVKSYATHGFHTAAPIAFGKSAAKLALFPNGNSEVGPRVKGNDYLRQEIAARLEEGPLSWTLRAQLFIDQDKTPIEDTSVKWDAPWVDLATLNLPRQDPSSPRGQEITELVSNLSFDPWHASEEHRPLGQIMRARRVAYAVSVIARQAAPEPTSVLSPG